MEFTDPAAHPASLSDTIVVGHDGSDDADAAYEFALRLAERLSSALLVVRAWTIDTAPHGTLVSGGYVSSFDEASAKVAQILQREATARASMHPGVAIRYRARFGQPAAVLIAESADALMLVVSRRGRGGFASLVLGSVSEQCVRHAHCPVLVVRHRELEGGDDQ